MADPKLNDTDERVDTFEVRVDASFLSTLLVRVSQFKRKLFRSQHLSFALDHLNRTTKDNIASLHLMAFIMSCSSSVGASVSLLGQFSAY